MRYPYRGLVAFATVVFSLPTFCFSESLIPPYDIEDPAIADNFRVIYYEAGDIRTIVPNVVFSSGSVIFIGLDGKLNEDNANFNWDDVNNELTLPRILVTTVTISAILNGTYNIGGLPTLESHMAGSGNPNIGTSTNFMGTFFGTDLNIRSGTSSGLQITRDSTLLPTMIVASDGTAAADAVEFRLQRTRNTIASPSNVTNLDVLGNISFGGHLDGSNAIGGEFRWSVDGTTGTRVPARLHVFTTDGTNITEAITLRSSGKVGINETSPAGKFHITDSTTGASPHSNADTLVIEEEFAAGISILSLNGWDTRIYFGDADSNTAGQIDYSQDTDNMDIYTNATLVVHISSDSFMGVAGCADADSDFEVGGTGTGCNTGLGSFITAGDGSWSTNSARRFKENIKEIPIKSKTRNDFFNTLIAASPKLYDFRSSTITETVEHSTWTETRNRFVPGRKNVIGFIGDEWDPVFPGGDPDIVNYNEVTAAMYMANQELIRENREQQVEINNLNGQLISIGIRLQDLEMGRRP